MRGFTAAVVGFVERTTSGRISADGRLDQLVLVRAGDGGGAMREGQARTGWRVEVELGFDPSALGDFWLEHCHQFRVETPSSRDAGVVDDVHVDPTTGAVISIDVAGGWFGRRRFTLPAGDVRAILPVERRLLADGRPETNQHSGEG